MNEDANTVQTELEKKKQRLEELKELREKLVGFRDVISKIDQFTEKNIKK